MKERWSYIGKQDHFFVLFGLFSAFFNWSQLDILIWYQVAVQENPSTNVQAKLKFSLIFFLFLQENFFWQFKTWNMLWTTDHLMHWCKGTETILQVEIDFVKYISSVPNIIYKSETRGTRLSTIFCTLKVLGLGQFSNWKAIIINYANIHLNKYWWQQVLYRPMLVLYGKKCWDKYCFLWI